jgi:uncharacterized protein
MPNRVILHHGWTNQRPEGHWLRLSAATLRSQGHQVWYPQFPDPETPDPETWLSLLEQESKMMDELLLGEKIAITHSLGCLNWMVGAITKRLGTPFDRILFVAPPDPIRTAEAEGISGEPFDLKQAGLRSAIDSATKSFTLVASDNDYWLPRGIKIYEEALGAEAVVLPGAGHFSLDDGWGPWPGLWRWVESGENQDLMLRQ